MEQLQSFAPLILMFLVVYLFMIRPQMKRSKQEKQFASDLKKGDKVVTKSGLHGKVLELNDKTNNCKKILIDAGADFVIDTLDDLPTIIDKLNN